MKKETIDALIAYIDASIELSEARERLDCADAYYYEKDRRKQDLVELLLGEAG